MAYQFDEYLLFLAGPLLFLTERVFLAHRHQQPRYLVFFLHYGCQSGPSFLLPELGFSFGQAVGPDESEKVGIFLSLQEDSRHHQRHLVASRHFCASDLGYL
jgi:hypothetical protein